MTVWDDVELVDFGDGERLERFGERLVRRPHPGALGPRRQPGTWQDADLHYDRASGWTSATSHPAPWTLEIGALRLELRPTETGQVGLFPEQLSMLAWLREQGSVPGEAPTILNLFAYTGLITLDMAARGASVSHVDASRPTTRWARQNAELSNLAGAPIRWIMDDAVAFVAREARRGRTYAGAVLDPPTYGHGLSGRDWRFARDLDVLLVALRDVLEPRAFVLLTAHTPDIDSAELAVRFAGGLGRPIGSIEHGDLAIVARDGRQLVLGTFARSPRRA